MKTNHYFVGIDSKQRISNYFENHMQRVSELAGEKAEMSVRYEKLESIYRVTILLRDKEKKDILHVVTDINLLTAIIVALNRVFKTLLKRSNLTNSALIFDRRYDSHRLYGMRKLCS